MAAAVVRHAAWLSPTYTNSIVFACVSILWRACAVRGSSKRCGSKRTRQIHRNPFAVCRAKMGRPSSIWRERSAAGTVSTVHNTRQETANVFDKRNQNNNAIVIWSHNSMLSMVCESQRERSENTFSRFLIDYNFAFNRWTDWRIVFQWVKCFSNIYHFESIL